MIACRAPRLLIFLCACAIPALCQNAAAPDPLHLLQSGRADEALRVLDSRIQSSRGDANAWNLEGRVYFQLKMWDDAVRCSEKAVKLEPDNSEYHLWLGRAYGEKADSIGPVGAFNLVRKVKGELEKAVALDTEGKNLAARADLAEFYAEAPGLMGGDKAKARALIDFVTKSDAALAHSMAANLAREQKKNDLAEREYKAAIEAGGNDARYQIMLASFYRKTGRLDEMVAVINKAAKAETRDGVALFDGAENLLAGGRNFPGAVEMLRRYLKTENLSEDGPAFDAHFLLGQLLERQGDPQGAAREYRAALAPASQFQRAQDALTRVSR